MKSKILPRAVSRFLRESKAATTIEYAIVVGVVVVGAAAAAQAFSDQIKTALDAITANISATTQNTGSSTRKYSQHPISTDADAASGP